MENIRFTLYALLLAVVFLIWQAWQEDAAKLAPEASHAPVATQQTANNADIPALDAPTLNPPAPGEVHQAIPVLASAERISVETDLFSGEIDALGGDLRRIALLKYPLSTDLPNSPVQLLSDRDGQFYVAQNGLMAASGPAPDHRALYHADAERYTLRDAEKSLDVPLHWTDPSGLTVTKRYHFERGSYVVGIDFRVENRGEKPWHGNLYSQLQQLPPPPPQRSPLSFMAPRTFTSVATYYDGHRYQKLAFDKLATTPIDLTQSGGWIAFSDHYFLGALLGDASAQSHYYSKNLPTGQVILGLTGDKVELAPGETRELRTRMFLGPKEQNLLADVAPGLELTVDYGLLTIIAKPLFFVLSWTHRVLFGNWGLAIIALTVLIKLGFFKLSEAQYRSMAKMREFAPRIQALRDRYGEDKQKLNEAMMELYRKEKFNPLGGCLPIFVQMPVFIALYWVLLESVELRQAPFFLWINDLSAKDPYYVLPVLFGISMLIQQRLSTAQGTMDPMQQRVMMMMPVVMTVFFALFPSGLVLYWVVSNSLGILQQWYITRKVESEKLRHAPAT
ncbi:MAG: membrane protein insertase YidC [Pseudomonadota bacterium]